MRLDHGMHQLVAAKNGVCRTGVEAQGAAYAPGFVNDSDCARAFSAMERIERLRRQAGDSGKALDSFHAARRALVDGGFMGCNGLGVGRAIGVAAAGALGLRQGRMDTFEKDVGWGRLGHSRYFPTGLTATSKNARRGCSKAALGGFVRRLTFQAKSCPMRLGVLTLKGLALA
jgi:hypothetical protein